VSDRAQASSPVASSHRAFGIVGGCAALSGLLLVVWVIDAIVTTNLAGRSTWGVSALAAAICWAGATVSMLLLHILRTRGNPMAGALLGMLVRMSIPLVIIFVATTNGGALADAGLAGQLVAFYLITLAIETCLSVALMRSAPKGSIGPAAAGGSASHV